MVGFDGEDACCRAERRLALNGSRCTVIGGDTNVLEDVGADEEEGVAGEGVEGWPDAGCVGEGVEGVVEIELRHGDGTAAECALQEGDVLSFFDGSLRGVGADERVGEGDFGEGGLEGDGACWCLR